MSIPDPAVSRRGLVFGAGVAWTIGAVILLVRSYAYLAHLSTHPAWPIGAAIIVGLLKGRFVFTKVARRNIERIKSTSPHKDKICLFAFQSIQSYLLVMVMIALGVTLRHTGLAPIWLIVVYVAIAVALLVSSSIYFRASRQMTPGPA